MSNWADAIRVLANGQIFRGNGSGARTVAVGEVVFNIGRTGYQGILTDPSYCGQLVCLPQPRSGVHAKGDVFPCLSIDNHVYFAWSELGHMR
ncbi:MAG: hypothetical protein HY304_04780 [candidate division Zixibacteria bacterium]|nr:hypothetical protein [candidate division Zixibacteria bacterium]